MGRFILEKSANLEDGYVLTDVENKVVITFIEHQFNESQKVTVLEDTTLSTNELAVIMREMGDFMVEQHYNIAMPTVVHQVLKKGDFFYVKRLKYPEFEIKITDEIEIDAHKLAQNLRKCAAWLDSPLWYSPYLDKC